MSARRLASNLFLATITPIQVALCRLRFRRGVSAPSDSALSTAPILVIRCEAKIGDNLLNVPFLRALRSACPGRPIHLLHHASARGVYQNCPYIDKRIEIDWPMSALGTILRRVGLCSAAIGAGASRARYALALVPRWDEDLYAPFMAWISGAPRVIGFSRRVLPEKAWRNLGMDLLLIDAVLDISVQHESQRPLQLLALVSNLRPALSPALEFWFSEQDMAAVAAKLRPVAPAETRWVAMAPGAALDRRKWPIERFAQVVRALSQRTDVRLMFLGTATENEDCVELARACGSTPSVNFAGELTLPQAAAVLSTCEFFIGNDSGLVHLASAVHTPVIEISCHPVGAALLHANSPARFGPTSELSTVLRPLAALGSVCSDGCASDVAHCITTVEADAAIQAASTLLDASAIGERTLQTANRMDRS